MRAAAQVIVGVWLLLSCNGANAIEWHEGHRRAGADVHAAAVEPTIGTQARAPVVDADDCDEQAAILTRPAMPAGPQAGVAGSAAALTLSPSDGTTRVDRAEPLAPPRGSPLPLRLATLLRI